MKMKLCDIAEVRFCFPERHKKGEIGETTFWATAANFQRDNFFGNLQSDENLKPMEQFRLLENDIVVKRINPIYVNFIDKEIPKCYAANNLIIVRTKQYYSAKFIAFALNEAVSKFVKDSSVGSVIPAISKSELDNLVVDVPSPPEANAIGEIWHLGLQKKQLTQRLSELETLSINTRIKLLIKNRGDKELC